MSRTSSSRSYPIRPHLNQRCTWSFFSVPLACLLLLIAPNPARAAAISWTAASGTNTNYLQTPTNAHATIIAAGQTLNVTGTGGLMAGTATDAGNTNFVYAIVKGPGTLNVNNATANIVVNQGLAANGNSFQRATLNLSGL